MDIRAYVRLLRLRWRPIAAGALLGLLSATVLTLATTELYEAKVQLFVGTTGLATDSSASGLAQGGAFSQQRVKSYAQIISSPAVTGPVIKSLNLSVSEADLAGEIKASAPLDTVLIDVNVRDRSAERAQLIADAVGREFTRVVATLEAPTTGGPAPVRVSVVRPADVPTSPISPRPAVNIATGLLAGLVLGGALALLAEALDTRVRSAHEIDKLVSLSTLGIIAYDDAAEKQPLILESGPYSLRSEAFRQLRTNLKFVDIDSPPRSIMLTSALPEEGKTTTCCNLAIALAESGLRIALVEADLRRPRLAAYLGIEGAAGLTDVLTGRTHLDEVLQLWGTNGLQVLPSGPTPPNPSEMLGSQRMREMLQELESRVDLVLVDVPPVLPVTDAAVVAAEMDGVILVLRAGRVTREQLTRSVESLLAVGANLYGAVLNMVPTRGPDAYRDSRYGYQPQDLGQGVMDGAKPASLPSSRTTTHDAPPL